MQHFILYILLLLLRSSLFLVLRLLPRFSFLSMNWINKQTSKIHHIECYSNIETRRHCFIVCCFFLSSLYCSHSCSSLSLSSAVNHTNTLKCATAYIYIPKIKINKKETNLFNIDIYDSCQLKWIYTRRNTPNYNQ